MLPLDIGRPYWIVDKDLICFLVSLFVFKLNFPPAFGGMLGAFADTLDALLGDSFESTWIE